MISADYLISCLDCRLWIQNQRTFIESCGDRHLPGCTQHLYCVNAAVSHTEDSNCHCGYRSDAVESVSADR